MSLPIQPPTPIQLAVSPIGVEEDSDVAMKWKVLNGKVKTGIDDVGASASCGQPEISDCGMFEVNGNLFNPTGRKSTKIFQYVGGSIAATEKKSMNSSFTFAMQQKKSTWSRASKTRS